ncbi:hypothetical protein Tco_0756593 [Tanacetum coccineum]
MSATSSNHAKILAIHEASRECVWLRSVIQHIRKSSRGISSDRSSYSCNIKIVQQDICKKGDTGDIIVQKVRSSDKQADSFTKSLPTTTFKKLAHDTGMRRLN